MRRKIKIALTSFGLAAASVVFGVGATQIGPYIGVGSSLSGITAGQVGGEPANANIQSHIGSSANPHSVTAGQAGAEPANANIQSHIGSAANPHSVTKGQVGLGSVANKDLGLVDNQSKVTMFTNPTFTGTATGSFSGSLSGNATSATTAGAATTANTATNFNGSLAGDIIGTQGATAIAGNVITNADINTAAAIAGTKISPNFGNQQISTVISTGISASFRSSPGTTDSIIEVLSGNTGSGAARINFGDISAPSRVRMTGGRNGEFIIDTESAITAFKISTGGVVTGTYGAYHPISDARFKEHIEIISDPLEKIMKIRGVTFNWIPSYELYNDGEKYSGLIAQDVEAVLPEAVNTNDDSFQTKSISYWQMSGLYVESIKALKVENDLMKDWICEQANAPAKLCEVN